MVHILICNKPSTRFPGKNALLFDYTYIWLLHEIYELEEEFRVYTVGKPLDVKIPSKWRHIDTPCDNHHKDIRLAMDTIAAKEPDVYVLPQLTQPLRRKGLMIDAINNLRKFGLPVISASKDAAEDWRKVDVMGKWGNREHDTNQQLMYDGALYVWNNATFDSIFNNTAPHSVVINTDTVVDIDYENDIPPNLNKMWTDLILK